MPRNPVPAALKVAAIDEPLALAMEDDDLVPEGAFGIDNGDVGDGEIEPGPIRLDIRPDDASGVGARADFAPDSILTCWST